MILKLFIASALVISAAQGLGAETEFNPFSAHELREKVSQRESGLDNRGLTASEAVDAMIASCIDPELDRRREWGRQAGLADHLIERSISIPNCMPKLPKYHKMTGTEISHLIMAEAELHEVSRQLDVPWDDSSREYWLRRFSADTFSMQFPRTALYLAIRDPSSPEYKAMKREQQAYERQQRINAAIEVTIATLALMLASAALWYSIRKGLWRRRHVRIAAVGFIAWTAFVMVRTDDSHELLGFYLEQWGRDEFFVNWLLPPGLILMAIYARRWIIAGGK